MQSVTVAIPMQYKSTLLTTQPTTASATQTKYLTSKTLSVQNSTITLQETITLISSPQAQVQTTFKVVQEMTNFTDKQTTTSSQENKATTK